MVPFYNWWASIRSSNMKYLDTLFQAFQLLLILLIIFDLSLRNEKKTLKSSLGLWKGRGVRYKAAIIIWF